MKRNQSSLTAAGIAVARAVESEKPAGERICYDPFASRFLGRLFYSFMRFWIVTGYTERTGPGVAGFLVARARYIDDRLQACIEDGLEQLVILGAGYDSRAYRFEQLKGRVKVFEVDHPPTQRDKLAKLKRVFGAVPDHVVYVPIDFDRESLEVLFAHGYDRALKTLFIWEGVTHYITAQAVDGTLAFVAGNSRPGSSIVFDYLYTWLLAANRRGEISRMRRYGRLLGEGLVFAIEEGSIETFLTQRGFRDVTNAGADDLKRLYFTGPNARRRVASGYAIATATVVGREDDRPA